MPSASASRPGLRHMIEIILQETAHGGRYEARVAGRAEAAELTFVKAGPGKIIANHTGVPDSLRGQGVGQALVARLVADARAAGLRIAPRCPFVRAQAERHPEWADVFDA